MTTRVFFVLILVLSVLPLHATDVEMVPASAPLDILEAIRAAPLSRNFLETWFNVPDMKDTPALRESLLVPTDEVEILKDVPNGFVQVAKHWNRDHQDPEYLEFALFRGESQRWVLVGSYHLNHPDGFFSRREAWLWEKGAWREASGEILPHLDLQNFYPAKKSPAKIYRKIVVELRLPRKGTDMVAIPHDEDETDPSQEIREGEEEFARLHPNIDSEKHREAFFKAYVRAVKKAPYQKLTLTFDRKTCRFSVRVP